MLFKSLYLTVFRKIYLAEPAADPYRAERDTTFTFCVWHDSLLTPLFLARQPATMALVGGHRDGTFLANALKSLKIDAARGSSSQGGTAAVRYLMEAGQTHHLVLTPDGPRGPRRQMKTGCAFLASRTGKPVVPTAFLANRYWSVGAGWTDLHIPKPFSTVYVITAPSITIPPDANREELQEYTEKIQAEMDRINLLIAEMAGHPVPAPVEPVSEASA